LRRLLKYYPVEADDLEKGDPGRHFPTLKRGFLSKLIKEIEFCRPQIAGIAICVLIGLFLAIELETSYNKLPFRVSISP
jgi:hypothetical protein